VAIAGAWNANVNCSHRSISIVCQRPKTVF
jgi:hypothetical protein